ncbi:Phosphoglucosamine mutase [Candidatus Ecksteinia adelgidicola]|nr:Phosphoglucosamine mutase [Candidatus Ecksteinia adelgidicola]
MSDREYFGTDGIRGKVGTNPITPDFILKLGWAAGKVLSRHGSRKIIIGKDTRISGYMLESALAAGLASAGLSTYFTGPPIPTPAIAYLTRSFRAAAGIVISASHNLFYDNGVKFFSNYGTKLPKSVEEDIESKMKQSLICVNSSSLGKTSRINDAARRYIKFCKSTFSSDLSLKGLKIIVDCANGATHHIAPNVLCELGAIVIPISITPNGTNINKKCGTTDIRHLKTCVIKQKADIGLSFDGDGDRVIMVDHLGNKVDGDQILYIIIREKMRKNQFYGGAVGTIMSNIGLELALKKLKIPFERTQVGDCYILEKLKELGWHVGAENSGHIILLDKTTTGDGIIAALQVLTAMVNNHVSLYHLCRNITLLPQILINVSITGNSNPLKSIKVCKISKQVKNILADHGRVLLRKSGTERLIRIMVEGENKQKITILAKRIANAVKIANF